MADYRLLGLEGLICIQMRFPKVLTAVMFSMLVSGALALASGQPDSDHFRLSYSIHIERSGAMKVWLPLAHDMAFQQVKADIPNYISRHVGANGNVFGFAEVVGPCDLTVNYVITREEQETANPDNVADVGQWLKPDKLVPLNDAIRDVAGKVTETVGAKASNALKARAIYDYVVSTMKYDKSGEGWGRGDLMYACSALKGNCTDFHSLFIGLCRASRVPARVVMGLSVPKGDQGKIEGYHCWAEFFDPKAGWVPVDASMANQTQERQYYFGKLDPRRVAFTVGRDLQLQPPPSSDPLNYMIYAYAEQDGKRVPTKTMITYHR